MQIQSYLRSVAALAESDKYVEDSALLTKLGSQTRTLLNLWRYGRSLPDFADEIHRAVRFSFYRTSDDRDSDQSYTASANSSSTFQISASTPSIFALDDSGQLGRDLQRMSGEASSNQQPTSRDSS